MRCSACLTDKAPDQFSKSQKNRAASARKCSTCVTAATVLAGGDSPSVLPPRGGSTAAPAATATVARESGAAGEDREGPPEPALELLVSDTGAAADTGDSPAGTRVCAWAGCGRQLSADPRPGEQSKCGRCKRSFYCDQRCQKKHWREGGHKEECVEPPSCTICLDGGDEPLPIQGGCGCRGDGGLAHVACRAEVATRKARGGHKGWVRCPTCGQRYTGAMELGLAQALVHRMRTRSRDDEHRLCAEGNLGNALIGAGEFGEAAEVLTRVLAVVKRMKCADHPITLATAANLANLHRRQGDFAAAEALQVEGLAASRRVNGKEHPDTLDAATNLAVTYGEHQGRHAEAEELLVMVLEVHRRVDGKEHPRTLGAIMSLATTYSDQGRLAEAEGLLVGLLATSMRVRGSEHPETLDAAGNLAATYNDQGKHAEAEVLLLEMLESSRLVRGAGHPATLRAAHMLTFTHGHLGKIAEAAALVSLYSL